MKTITIPEYKNPFIVVINNSVYQYKGGETIEVPDDVAEAIEDAIELIPKPKRYLSKFAQRIEGSLVQVTATDLEGITAVTNRAFHDLKSLKYVTFPDSITTIGISAFYGCVQLESIRFGDSSRLQSISNSAFNWCSNMSKVYLPLNPPMLENIDAFGNIKSSCVFYCKSQASLDAYKAATNWSTLTGTYSFVVEA